MKIRFLGDVHGKLRSMPHANGTPIVQVGDLGVGFVALSELDRLEKARDFHFIRGNHDHPALCRKHARYLGDFGVAPKHLGGFFFVSGAFSIDKARRLIGIDWWPEEELSIMELDKALLAYRDAKPDVMVTHCPPESILRAYLSRFPGIGSHLQYDPSRTEVALEMMLAVHRPRLWIFGHLHHKVVYEIEGTEFRCLAELESYIVDL